MGAKSKKQLLESLKEPQIKALDKITRSTTVANEAMMKSPRRPPARRKHSKKVGIDTDMCTKKLNHRP
jgi:hypothetical protein